MKKQRDETFGRALFAALFVMTGLPLPTPKTEQQPLPGWKRKSRDNKPLERAAPKLANSHAGVFGGGLGFKRAVYRIKPLYHFIHERVADWGTNPAPLSQHQRVFAGRVERDSKYPEKVWVYIDRIDGVGVPLA